MAGRATYASVGYATVSFSCGLSTKIVSERLARRISFVGIGNVPGGGRGAGPFVADDGPDPGAWRVPQPPPGR
ncbi:hypothetical protein GCM10009790_04150 [Georgenia ruanii]